MSIEYSAVACLEKDRGIGKRGQGMLWHLKSELKHFKELTIGFPVVMGRKTWETLAKPLAYRQNIILTTQKDYQADGAIVIHSPEEIEQLVLIEPNVMVIGGVEIWKAFWPKINTLYISQLFDSYPECDLFFPDYLKDFELYREESQVAFIFRTYKRRQIIA